MGTAIKYLWGKPVFGPRFEPVTYQIRIRNAIYSTTKFGICQNYPTIIIIIIIIVIIIIILLWMQMDCYPVAVVTQ
jgi:hypothetical protein